MGSEHKFPCQLNIFIQPALKLNMFTKAQLLKLI